jgi:hypothetical protein
MQARLAAPCSGDADAFPEIVRAWSPMMFARSAYVRVDRTPLLTNSSEYGAPPDAPIGACSIS